MTLCERTLDDLKAYLDGELRWPANWSVRRHLASCPGCRQELDEMRALQSRLRSTDAGELPAALRARILAACGNASPSSVSTFGFQRRFRPQLAWGTAAVVLLIAFACGPYLSHPLLSPSEVMKGETAGGAKSANSVAPPPKAAAPAVKDASVLHKALSENPSSSLPAKLQDRIERSNAAKSGPASGGSQDAPVTAFVKPGNAKSVVTATRPDQNASIATGKPVVAAESQADFTKKIKDETVRLEMAKSGVTAQGLRGAAGPGGGGAAPDSRLPEIISPRQAVEEKVPLAIYLAVDDVAQKSAFISASARSAGGVVRQQPSSLTTVSDNLTIDVPVDRLSETVEQIKKQGEVVNSLSTLTAGAAAGLGYNKQFFETRQGGAAGNDRRFVDGSRDQYDSETNAARYRGTNRAVEAKEREQASKLRTEPDRGGVSREGLATKGGEPAGQIRGGKQNDAVARRLNQQPYAFGAGRTGGGFGGGGQGGQVGQSGQSNQANLGSQGNQGNLGAQTQSLNQKGAPDQGGQGQAANRSLNTLGRKDKDVPDGRAGNVRKTEGARDEKNGVALLKGGVDNRPQALGGPSPAQQQIRFKSDAQRTPNLFYSVQKPEQRGLADLQPGFARISVTLLKRTPPAAATRTKKNP